MPLCSFGKKNHEEQNGKIPYGRCSADSVFVKLKTYENEKEHGKHRPGDQDSRRCNYCDTLLYEHIDRDFGHHPAGAGRCIPAHEYFQLLSALCSIRAKYMCDEEECVAGSGVGFVHRML